MEKQSHDKTIIFNAASDMKMTDFREADRKIWPFEIV